MRSCKSSMDSTTLRAAARALIMKKAAARPKTYISPYHRRAIGPGRIRMGWMSGFGNTRGHPTDVEDSFQVHPAQLRLDAGTGFRYIREAGQGVGEHGKGRVSARLGRAGENGKGRVLRARSLSWQARGGRGRQRLGRAGEDRGMPLGGGEAYSPFDAGRRMLEPLRRGWGKFTPAETEGIITEL